MPLLPREQVLETGLQATYTAADVGGDTFENDGRTILHIINGSGSPITVTVPAEQSTTRKPGFGELAKADAQVAVGATDDQFLGPFPAGAFGVLASVTYSDVTTLTVAVLKV